MTRESGAGPDGTESPDGEGELTQDQHFTTFEDDGGRAGVWRTEPLGLNETPEELSGRGRKSPL